jgi:hypothetical protein
MATGLRIGETCGPAWNAIAWAQGSNADRGRGLPRSTSTPAPSLPGPLRSASEAEVVRTKSPRH